jgi:hypothetical protein
MHYAMQTYDAMEALGHKVLTASLGRSQLSQSKPGYFNPGGRALPNHERLGWPENWYGCLGEERKSLARTRN